MRFFGKRRDKRSQQQQQQQQPPASKLVSDSRSDVTTIGKNNQHFAAPNGGGVRDVGAPLHNMLPTQTSVAGSRPGVSSDGRPRRQQQQQQLRYPMQTAATSPPSKKAPPPQMQTNGRQQSSPGPMRTSPVANVQQYTRPKTTVPFDSKQHTAPTVAVGGKSSPNNQSNGVRVNAKANPSNAAVSNTTTNVKKPPQSILHKHKPQQRQQHPPPPPYTDNSPPSTYYDTMNPNNRVRFLSSSSSVASSSAASEVHLMAGPGSVASSAMSSSRGDAENVFDKVLHMVMDEEEQRLKAMGMNHAGGVGGGPVSYARRPQYGGISNNATEESEDNSYSAPIDIDTGLEVGYGGNNHVTGGGSVDNEYHVLNDDEIDERRYRSLLNESALNSSVSSTGAINEGVDFDRRSRSYDPRMHQHQQMQLQGPQYRQSGSYEQAPQHHHRQAEWSKGRKKASPTSKDADKKGQGAMGWVAFDSRGSFGKQGGEGMAKC
ncbi:predicted protein [Thalassiosira pseudonana CCMP1335]|uniref:Uncharacterized protein n=1 Tax=Thalassiosira pseudonana TaxID=35128 RepID=B8BQF1_THAPS|nr:predicted protein [Thalassiosira pseudonana CCMP1335]EED96354.1 predicted protein [Thalassiosira pseudonana CCMP1335]